MSKELFLSVFEKNVEMYANDCAVVCGNETVTYEELNQKANILASRLTASGVSTGTVVGVLMDRGVNLLTAIIAIFKTRCVYMPLDKSYPQERLQYMLNKSECELVLVAANTKEHPLFDDNNSPLILNTDNLTDKPVANFGYVGESSDLAYIIFTSGTTGQPKGVMIEQKSLINHLNVKVSDLEISQSDRVAETASQCFDISMWQFLSALTQGGTTVIIDSCTMTDPAKITAEINDKSITIMQFVPSLLREFVSSLETKDSIALSTLRYISTVGEPLLPELCRRWLKLYPQTPLLNHYGPTECADGVTHYMNTHSPQDDEIHMPIGKPIKNLKAYILTTTDAGLKQLKPGEVGELYISGIGLARGYINDEEKTAQVFLENPFLPKDPLYSRIYRTGDLVRERKDGFLECLGREDRQVKLRGYRIELNEIENILNAHDAIQGSAVIVHCGNEKSVKLTARERIGADQSTYVLPRLVAYIEFSHYCSRSDLIDYIAQHLPDYMLPDMLLSIDKLSLNSNGKLDYKSLPQPSELMPILDHEYVAAETEEQQSICQILSDVLHVPRIGLNDYFLEIGGDSLRAMLTVNHIQQKYNVKLSIQELYQYTIAELVEAIKAKKVQLPMIPALTKKDESIKQYPASHIQKHLWFLWQLDPSASNYTLQTALEWDGPLEFSRFNHAWNKLIESYETLRIRFYQDEGELFCQFNNYKGSMMDCMDLSMLSGDLYQQQMDAIKSREFDKPFDIENSNLYRAVLVKKSEDKYVIILTTHEIIIDAWSLSVIVRSLRDLYNNYEATSALLDNPERITFSDFTVWESQYLNQETLKESKMFWDQQLSGEIPVLALPSDKARPQRRDYLGSSQAITIHPSVANKLRAIAVENKTTIFSVILTSFYILLHKYSGQEDIIVGSPHVIREEPGTENLIGFFLNMLPLRTTINEKDSFIDLLKRSQNTVSGAVSNSLYPFSWMVDSLDIVRKSNVSPVFQVMFNMYSERAEHTPIINEENQLSIVAKELENGHTKYDLTLYCQEEGDAIYLQFSYCKDLYSDQFMERMLANLDTLVDNIVSDPTRTICEIDALHHNEHQFLRNYNGQKQSYPNQSISSLFDQQVGKTPEAVAYYWNGGEITYCALNKRVNAIAANLYRHGVRSADKVVIGEDRGIDVIATILAVVKLQAAYVILNDTYPQLRVQEILIDVSPKLLIATKEQYSWINDGEIALEIPLILIDQVALKGDEQPIDITESCVGPDTLLQVVYTSGSTGKPKGVVIPMTSCLNRLQWMWKEHPFVSSDVGIVQKSATLVASSWEIFGPLLRGVPSVLVSQQELIDPTIFVGLLNTYQVSHLLCSPPVLNNLLVENEFGKEWSALRFVTSSAESLPPALAKRFKEQYKNVSLYNYYGSSECSSNAAWYEVVDVNEDDRTVPIGIPVGNVALAVTDNNGKALPQGAIGNIDIAGECLALGYLNNDHDQDSVFFSSDRHCLAPFSSRVYRTGDLGRFNDQQKLELLGRVDDQVQVNGYRVELNEVTNILLKHEKVRAATTILFTNNAVPMLASYIVLNVASNNEAEAVSEKELQGYLKDYLLPHVVPKSICIMDELPKLKSGKLDKKALPQPSLVSTVNRDSTIELLTTNTEKSLADIWQKLLGVDSIGANDDFFSLGGSSIVSVRCIADAAKAGLQCSVTDLYDYPVLKDLAAVIDEKCISKEGITAGKDLILTPTIRFVAERMKGDEHWNMFGLWEATSANIDFDLLTAAFCQLTMDYPYLTARMTKKEKEEALSLVVSNEGVMVERQQLGTFDHTEACEKKISETVSAIQQEFVFNKQSSLTRLIWIDAEVKGQRRQWLFLIVHHYLIDGAGFRLLLDEIERYYDYQLKNNHCKPIYQDGRLLNTWVNNIEKAVRDSLSKEIHYWTSQPWDLLLVPVEDLGEKGQCVSSMNEKNRLGKEIDRYLKQQQYQSTELKALCQANNEWYYFIDVDTTNQLLDLNYFVHGFSAYDLFLYALVVEMSVGRERKSLYIDSYDMHRGPTLGDCDLSKVMGMAVQFVPLPLIVNESLDISGRVSSIHKQRHEQPNCGLGLRAMKMLLDDECPRDIADIPLPKVNINYRATLRKSRGESLLDMDRSQLWLGESLGLNENHYHPLRITIDIENNHMRFHMRYNANEYSSEYVSSLGERVVGRLKKSLSLIQTNVVLNIKELCPDKEVS